MTLGEMSAYPVTRKRKYVRKYPVTTAKRSRWSTYGAAGMQLARDVMYLKTLINSEPHNWYVNAGNNYNYNGAIVSLSNVTVGNSEQDRTGNRVLPRYLNVKWYVTTGSVNNLARVMLIRYWGEATSAAPGVTVAEVMRTTALGTVQAPLAHLNEDNTGPKGDRARRVEVLRSELVTLDNEVERRMYSGEWDVQVNGMNVQRKEHIEWRSSTTEEPVSGGFYMIFIGASATNDAYQLESKMTFYDN